MQIHQEMRSKLKELPAGQLDILHLSAEQYTQSLRGDDEIEVSEKMYDIARVETQGNIVTVYCLQDVAEDNLLSFLDEVLKNANHDAQQPSSSLFQFNFLSFILPSKITLDRTSLCNISHYTSYLVYDNSFITSLNTPPPRS